MDLFLVLFLFGIILFATGQVTLRAIKLFENRERYHTTAILEEIEYRDNSKTTIYHVSFNDMNEEKISAKSIQYKGKPRFKIGDTLDIDYLIRDEMKDLIENELVDVLHPEHLTIYESFKQKPLKIINFISVVMIFSSIISLIIYFLK